MRTCAIFTALLCPVHDFRTNYRYLQRSFRLETSRLDSQPSNLKRHIGVFRGKYRYMTLPLIVQHFPHLSAHSRDPHHARLVQMY